MNIFKKLFIYEKLYQTDLEQGFELLEDQNEEKDTVEEEFVFTYISKSRFQYNALMRRGKQINATPYDGI
jgi:hypothetical protein